MIFHTHDQTPKYETKQLVKRLFGLTYGLFAALFLFMAIAISISVQSVMPGIIILGAFIFLNVFVSAFISDIRKAYVQIEENCIMIADYYFFIKKEKTISVQEIKKVEILPGVSFRVRGPRLGNISYIVFRDENDKYLFKVIYCPETEEYFARYF
ncbi:MAG: hypothetical protein E7603_04160 [Ruminococcaceae bacterium]|nr:hypothetical protein [Oscillospiraceae bacterium]